MKLSIIIPVFNEEKTIKILLERVAGAKLPKGLNREIIIIDDGSSDSTSKIISRIKKIKFKYFKNNINLGKGASIRIGFKKTSGDFIIIQDADLEYNPQDFSKLLKPITDGESKVVYGSRLINYPLRLWGENKTVMPTHLIGNKFLTGLTNLLYGSNLTDMETCYKIFKSEVILGLNLISNRFEIEPEITAKILKKGIQIVEVPIVVKPRTPQEGKKISWKDGFIAVWTLIKHKFFCV